MIAVVAAVVAVDDDVEGRSCDEGPSGRETRAANADGEITADNSVHPPTASDAAAVASDVAVAAAVVDSYAASLSAVFDDVVVASPVGNDVAVVVESRRYCYYRCCYCCYCFCRASC